MENAIILKKSVLKSYLKYLLPTVIGMVTYSLYCLADVLFVSLGVGKDGLAALNISLPIFTLYSSLAILIGVGASITMGICKGEGLHQLANKVFTMALVTSGILGILFMIFSILFTEKLALLLGANDLIMADVLAYLLPVTWGIFFYMLYGTLTVVVRGDGNPTLVMIAGIVGNSINILLDYVFIIPLNMGTFGAGLATAIGFSISMFILCFHFILKKNTVHFTRNFFDKSLFIRLVKNGTGASLLEVSTGFTIFLLNLALMQVSGSTAVAIFSIISNIAFIAKGLFGGMAQASQPIISLNYGQKNFEIVKLAYRYAMIIAGSTGLIVFILLGIFSKFLISSLVSSEASIILQGTTAIWLYFIAFSFTGFNTVLMYYFQSIEHSLYSTLMSLTRGIVLIFILLLVLPLFLGEKGIWLVSPVTEVLTFSFFMMLKRKKTL
ncbi:hypothetical protein CS063_14490 [Sporanaerobium hydrogeniformans]|uniref:Uncharacterized protein n=1 Tax=Sporanaerobium hydrogeniformans TaxID=3072179 RepID=A0AC61D9L3_9FIRM|nr:MATE family efflux transporter [Sporanaerobium hydrogeniformans]PHV69702.1 hypothetical protein CS063_14490 [Sporanaerobium hydrogeniformans]